MGVEYNEYLSSIPGYKPGVPKGHSAEDVAGSTLAQLASNESPYPPLPEVVQAIAAASESMNRYPDPDSTLLRRQLAELHGVDFDRITIANGSCEILLTAAETLLRPDTSIVYAWPAFSIYPMLAAMREAEDIKVPLADGEVHDLEAMLGAIKDNTRLVLLCNPNNPTGTYIPFPEVAAFIARVPKHAIVLIDEAYIEFQLHDQSDSSLSLLSEYENVVILRSFSKSHSLAGLRVGYAIGPPAFGAAAGAVRQPFGVNALAQAAAVEALKHGETIQAQIRTAIAERNRVEEGFAAIGLETAETQANFSWVSLGENGVEIEDHVIADLAEAGLVVRAGRLLGGPGRLRISYGTPEENDRLLAALGDSIHRHS